MKNNFVAGIDVGGSHITAAVINISTGELVEKTLRRKSINSKAGHLEIIRDWTSVINSSFNSIALSPSKIGMAMPGPFDYDEGVCLISNQDKYDSLYGLNIKHLLADCLLIEPSDIVLTNDAACFLYGELFNGAAKNASDAVGITLGTGFGSAYVKDGRVVDGEWWCAPFRDGIAEDYLSTRWFVNRYAELTGDRMGNVKNLLVDEQADRETVKRIFQEFGKNLGEFLVSQKISESAETLVIGGNIAHSFPLFESFLEETLVQHGLHLEVKKGVLGEHAALFGAASNCYKKSCEVNTH